MNHDVLVSVIVACRNSEKFLKLCMDSLINQSYHNIEIVVCDDASTDNSYALLEEYAVRDPRIILLKNEECLYAASTRNRCIEKSSGKYIVIQDADDFSAYDRIEKLKILLEQNDKIDFISSSAYIFSNDHTIFDKIKRVRIVNPKKSDFLWGMPFIHAAMIFRTTCIKNINGYRVAKETKRGQDYDMLMRMYAAGFKGMNINSPLYWIRSDSNMLKRQLLSNLNNEFKIRLFGFKALGLLPIGYIFCLKPYFAFFYHSAIYYWQLFRRRI